MGITNDRMLDILRVYFIMGSINCLKDPRNVLQEAIEGGITLFQFREKGTGSLKGEEKYQLAKSLQSICKRSGVPFIVNDDVELAINLNADGVHIGQEDEAVELVRKKIGNKILGVSAHTVEEAELAIEKRADYLGIGPIFSTTTKEDAKQAKGSVLIQQLRESGIYIPLVGIGGINTSNASSVIAAGADGVSVITEISHAYSPMASASVLKTAVESVLSKK